MSKLYGLLGEKLGHSISPEIHSTIFKELALDAAYLIFEVQKENLKQALEGLKALGAKGINVTIPYKVEIMKYLDSVSDEAEKIGAVNTICFNEGKAGGFNTDYFGFGMLLERYDIKIEDQKCIVLGTGGASKAVVQYLQDNAASDIILVTRDLNKKSDSMKEIKCIDYQELENSVKGSVLINCTPKGMFPDINSSPVSETVVSRFESIVDLIYNPHETLLLKYAKQSGANSANGLYMLIGQALAAEELWHGREIDKNIVDKIYNMYVGEDIDNNE